MMFVNDIIASINTNIHGIVSVDEMKLFLILFADDQVLFATSPTSLQLILNDIETYYTSWDLKINVAKTKVLTFEQSVRHTHYNFYLNNETLEVVTNMLPKQCTGYFLISTNMNLKKSEKS